jgi:hypothetical protein
VTLKEIYSLIAFTIYPRATGRNQFFKKSYLMLWLNVCGPLKCICPNLTLNGLVLRSGAFRR